MRINKYLSQPVCYQYFYYTTKILKVDNAPPPPQLHNSPRTIWTWTRRVCGPLLGAGGVRSETLNTNIRCSHQRRRVRIYCLLVRVPARRSSVNLHICIYIHIKIIYAHIVDDNLYNFFFIPFKFTPVLRAHAQKPQRDFSSSFHLHILIRRYLIQTYVHRAN